MNSVLTNRSSRRTLLQGAAGAAAVFQGGLAQSAAAQTDTPSTPEASTPIALTPIPSGISEDTFADLDAYISGRMEELKVPGVALGILGGGMQHLAGFGVTNVNHPLPVGEDTIFEIGSISKPVTGTAIMRLVEQGDLDLDAPVQTWLPEFRVADEAASSDVLLRHLVTHTAGWYDGADPETGRGDDALAKLVESMATLPQVTPPGEYFSYNNTGMCLAGRVIEAVTEQPYERAVADLVLQPLGMEHSHFFPEEMMAESFVVGHVLPPGASEPVVAEPWSLPRAMNPAGGMLASVTDLMQFARLHLGDGTIEGTPIVDASTLQFMQSELGPGGTVPSARSPIEALGVNWLLYDQGGERIVSHAGGANGQLAVLIMVPSQQFALVMMTNAEAGLGLAFEVTDRVMMGMLGLPLPDHAVAPLTPEQQAEYVGKYVTPDGVQTIVVEEQDEGLALQANIPGIGEVSTALRMIGDDLVIMEYMGLGIFADFVRDDTGRVAWMRFVGRLVPRESGN